MPGSPEQAGRVAIVTGASGGLGRATAARLARAGAAVSLLARDADDLAAAEAEITTGGGTALAVPTDLAEPAADAAAV